MGQNTGQIVFNIVGLVVSAYGYPMVGALIMGAGQALFPTELPPVAGPRLPSGAGDITTSSIGAPIPIIYGRQAVAGNIIWAGPLNEIPTTEEQGGKGGPTQEVTTYRYTRSFAIGLCEGQIAGVRKIWANAKLVYDASASIAAIEAFETELRANGYTQDDYDELIRQGDPEILAGQSVIHRAALNEVMAASMSVHHGTESQAADSVIEAVEGVGSVPGFRGLAYIVFEDYDVTDTGGRPPAFMFEVIGSGSANSGEIEGYEAKTFLPWGMDASLNAPAPFGNAEELPSTAHADAPDYPLNPSNSHTYVVVDTGYVNVLGDISPNSFSTVEEAIAAVEAARGRSFSNYVGWSYKADSDVNRDRGDGTFPFEDQARFVYLHFNSVEPKLGYESPSRHSSTAVEDIAQELAAEMGGDPFGPSSSTPVHGVIAFGVNGAVWGYEPGPIQSDSLVPDPWDRDLPYTVDYHGATYTYRIRISEDIVIRVERDQTCPADPCENATALPENADYCVTDGGFLLRQRSYIEESGTFLRLAGGATATTSLTVNGDVQAGISYVARPPQGPVIRDNSSNDNSAFWTNAYNRAVEAGRMPEGLSFSSDYPVSTTTACKWSYSLDDLSVQDVTLASIVEDLCQRAGLSSDQYDVSQLTQTVAGYRVGESMTVRDAINPLRQMGLFDAVESGTKLKFVLRGLGIAASIAEAELGAHEDGENRPSMMSVTRTQDVELPRQVRVTYALEAGDYQSAQQHAQRLQTDAVNVVDVNLPIVLTDDEAAQLADVLLNEAWLVRMKYQFALGMEYLALEPTDAVEIPVDGSSQRVRIVAIDHAVPGILQVEAVRDETSAYDSSKSGAPSGLVPGDMSELAGPTDLVVIDGPALAEDADDAGYYLAARGLLSGWRGCNVMRSSDGGQNYQQIAAISGAATMGTIREAMPEIPSPWLWDEASLLTVELASGSLESRTEAAVLNGANAAFIGRDGAWELIQFRNAALNSDGSYSLSGFLRGRKGTEWAIGESLAGDRFVFIGAGVVRVAGDSAGIGQARQLKAVSFGTTLQATAAEAFTAQGTALECYAPYDLKATTDSDTGDVTITWKRRTRLSGEWLDNADVALNEEAEAYDYEVRNAAGDLTGSGSVNGPSVTIDPPSALREAGSAIFRIAKLIDIGDDYLYGLTIADGSIAIRRFDRVTFELVSGCNVGGVSTYAATAFFYHSSAFYTAALATLTGAGGYVRTPLTAVEQNDPSQNVSYDPGIGDALGACMVGSQLWTLDTTQNLLRRLNTSSMAVITTVDLSTIGVTGGAFSTTGLATDGADLYVAIDFGSDSKVLRVATSGSPLLVWQSSLGADGAREIVVQGGKVFVNSDHASGLAVLNASDGSLAGYIADPVQRIGYPDLRLHVTEDGLVAVPVDVTSESVTTKFINPTTLQADSEFIRVNPPEYFVGQAGDSVAFSDGDSTTFYDLVDEGTTVTVWQKSATVGRGYPAEITL